MSYIGTAPRLLQILALSAAFVLPGWRAEAADKDGRYQMLGLGARSCGQWTADKHPSNVQDRLYFGDASWLLGYITAFNLLRWHGGNVASETDAVGMAAWVDNYCAANPTKDIATAADALTTFLSAGPHPNDK
jgi:hypothetical protein